MLEQMRGDIQGLKTGQTAILARMDAVEKGQEVIRTSQLKVELEQYPRIAAALDGFAVSTEKNAEQDRRISALENSTDVHDTRIWALEQIVKAK